MQHLLKNRNTKCSLIRGEAGRSKGRRTQWVAREHPRISEVDVGQFACKGKTSLMDHCDMHKSDGSNREK